MTLTFMRPAMALAIALSLAGCGGKATFPVNGTVTGLVYDGLTLTTNGMDVTVPRGATTFTFPNPLSYGDVYNVIVKPGVPPAPAAQPAHQFCTVANGADSAGHTASINVSVSCTMNSFTIGGTITGLKSAGLRLTNGSAGGTLTPLATDTAFTFGLPVPYNVTYGVSVLTQPATEVCSVSPNGTGIMRDAVVSNIVVTCVPKP
jgi:hypothetical protein